MAAQGAVTTSPAPSVPIAASVAQGAVAAPPPPPVSMTAPVTAAQGAVGSVPSLRSPFQVYQHARPLAPQTPPAAKNAVYPTEEELREHRLQEALQIDRNYRAILAGQQAACAHQQSMAADLAVQADPSQHWQMLTNATERTMHYHRHQALRAQAQGAMDVSKAAFVAANVARDIALQPLPPTPPPPPPRSQPQPASSSGPGGCACRISVPKPSGQMPARATGRIFPGRCWRCGVNDFAHSCTFKACGGCCKWRRWDLNLLSECEYHGWD